MSEATATWTIYESGTRGHRITRRGDRIDATRRSSETIDEFERRLAWGRIDELIVDWIAVLSGHGDPHAAEAPAGTISQYRSDCNVLLLPNIGHLWLVDADLDEYRDLATAVTKSHTVDRFVDAAARTLNSCLTWAHDADRWPDNQAAFGGYDARKAVARRRRRVAKTAPDSPGRSGLITLDDCPHFDDTVRFSAALADECADRYGEQARRLGNVPVVQYLTGTRVAECYALHTSELKVRAQFAHVTWQIDRHRSWDRPHPDRLARFQPPLALAKTGLPHGHPAQLWEWPIPRLSEIIAEADENAGGWLFATSLPESRRPLDLFEGTYLDVRKRADVAYPYTTHWHRHAYASYNLANAKDEGYEREVDEVAEWLGDLPGTVRKTYQHGGRTRRPGWSSHQPRPSTSS